MKSILTLLVAAAAFVAGAEQVSSVRARVTDGFAGDTSDVLALVNVRTGSEYSAQKCSQDVRTLRDTGRFDMVNVEISHKDGGVDIVYVVKRKMRFVGPLAVSGNNFWGESKIQSLSGLVDGDYFDDASLAAAVKRVRVAYQKEFFPEVQIVPVKEKVVGAGNGVRLRFDINEGERMKVRKFNFAGNEHVTDYDLRASFGQFPWWNPFGWFTEVPATAGALADAREAIARVYRDRGYLDVDVSDPERYRQDDGKYMMLFTIKEGPIYTFGDFKVTGVTKFEPTSVLSNNVSAVTGEPAGEKTLNDAAHEIELYYGSRGLADTQVVAKRIANAKDPTVLDVVFDVTEGVPVIIGDVKIRGNDITKDKVLRREIRLSPGDPLDEAIAERSQRRLENLRYFSKVRHYTETVASADPEKGVPETRDLVYEVTEQSTGNFSVGVGASSVDSVYVTAEVQETNFDLFHPWRFAGGGQKGRISAQVGPRIQSYEIGFDEPWFLDRQLEFSSQLYRRMRWFDQYDVIRSGGSIGLSYPVKFLPNQRHAFGRLGFRYTLEFIQFDDVEDEKFSLRQGETDPAKIRPLFKDEQHDYDDAIESVFRIYWAVDTRDQFLVPTRGYKGMIFGDLALGDNQYWKLGFNYSHYFTVHKKWGHVLNLRVRGETMDDLNDDIPIYDRLFLGGPRSVRGVEYREVGPRVWSGGGRKKHEAWGGKTLFMASAEYTIPIVKYLRFAMFTDLGSVGEDSFDPNFSDYLTWSVGCGLRLDLPNFPIRLDLATPIESPSETEDEVFSFSIGYDF